MMRMENKVAEGGDTDVVVNGRIVLADGSDTAFQITADGGWSQWGGTVKEMGDRVDLLQAIGDAVRELG